MDLPLDVWLIVLEYVEVELFRDVISLRSVSRVLNSVIKTSKPCRIRASPDGLSLEVNPDIYDDSNDFFKSTDRHESFRSIWKGDACKEWSGWLEFANRIIIPMRNFDEKGILELVDDTLRCMEESAVCIPEHFELKISQPCDPSHEYFHQLVERIQQSKLCFTVVITVKRPSKKTKKITFGDKIKAVDAYMIAEEERENLYFFTSSSPENERKGKCNLLPSAWNISREPNKWDNLILSEGDRLGNVSPGAKPFEHIQLYTSLCVGSLVLSNINISTCNFAQWTKEGKRIHISDGHIRTDCVRGKISKSRLFELLERVGFCGISFRKVSCKNRTCVTLQFSKDHGHHIITLWGCNVFDMLLFFSQRNVLIKALDISLLGYDYKIENYVPKVKNLERVVITVSNKGPPKSINHLTQHEAEETLESIKARLVNRSTNPYLTYLCLTYYDYGTLWSRKEYIYR